jgi:hypothetical protein
MGFCLGLNRLETVDEAYLGVARLLRAGATVRAAGPYVEINLPGEHLVLRDHAVHRTALATI